MCSLVVAAAARNGVCSLLDVNGHALNGGVCWFCDLALFGKHSHSCQEEGKLEAGLLQALDLKVWHKLMAHTTTDISTIGLKALN